MIPYVSLLFQIVPYSYGHWSVVTGYFYGHYTFYQCGFLSCNYVIFSVFSPLFHIIIFYYHSISFHILPLTLITFISPGPPFVLRHRRLGIAARGGRARIAPSLVFAAAAATAPFETAGFRAWDSYAQRKQKKTKNMEHPMEHHVFFPSSYWIL